MPQAPNPESPLVRVSRPIVENIVASTQRGRVHQTAGDPFRTFPKIRDGPYDARDLTLSHGFVAAWSEPLIETLEIDEVGNCGIRLG